MADVPSWVLQFGGMAVGAICAYYGALNAMREDIATLKAQVKAATDDASEAKQRAQIAHDRIDRMLAK